MQDLIQVPFAIGSDTTYRARQQMIDTGQAAADLSAHVGQQWPPEQLTADFAVIGFAAPFVVVRRKSDSVVGTLEFTHHPRVYFSFEQAEVERMATYHQLVGEASDRLDGALADIVRSQDAGELTVREAADNRVAVLEAHLNRLRLLRDEYLGSSG